MHEIILRTCVHEKEQGRPCGRPCSDSSVLGHHPDCGTSGDAAPLNLTTPDSSRRLLQDIDAHDQLHSVAQLHVLSFRTQYSVVETQIIEPVYARRLGIRRCRGTTGRLSSDCREIW